MDRQREQVCLPARSSQGIHALVNSYFAVLSAACPLGTATLTHTAALARLGHALSDPTRVGILLALREAPAYPSDLADALGVSRQVMSNQLACLRGCGLVESIPDGRRAWYRLADEHLGPGTR